MEQILQLNEFFIEGGDQSKSHVLLHISEPSTPEEKEKGYFFAICEINNAETKYITELQDIIDRVENEYYEITDDPEKTALEKILEKVNQETIALVKPSVELHCIIGAIRQPEILFTYYGKPQIHLFYKNRSGLYQKMDLLANNDEPTSERQMFSNLIQGKISANDFFLAATPHVTNCFSPDRLEKIITTRPVQQSIQHIERVLSELRDGYSYGGVILHLNRTLDTVGQVKKAPPRPHGGSVKSLTNLFSTEQETASTLSPSMWPRLNNRVKELLKTPQPETSNDPETPKKPLPRAEIASAHLRPHRKQEASRPETIRIDRQHITNALAFVGRAVLTVARALWWLVLAIITLISSLLRSFALMFFVITNYQNRRRLILENWGRLWASYKGNFERMPLITKLLFVGALCFVVVFAASIVYLRMNARQAARQKAFSDALTMVLTKKDSAESLLIYRNEAAALTELQSAEETLKTLRCETKTEKEECAAVAEQLQSLYARARRITVVQPELLADWTGAPAFAGTDTNILKVNGTIYAVSANTSSIASYNLLTQESKLIETDIKNQGFVEITAPKENDYVLITNSKGGLVALNPADNSSKNFTITYPVSAPSAQANVVYNRRLYLLDTTNNQVYKFDGVKDGFGAGKEWIKETAIDVKDGSDITIDGDIFVLKNNGMIQKFASGNSTAFSIQGLSPNLGAKGKIWTYTDSNYLYVLDPDGKRLVIMDKDGRVKAQLTASEFTAPSGMTIDEPNRIAYILDSGKLYKIIIPE